MRSSARPAAPLPVKERWSSLGWRTCAGGGDRIVVAVVAGTLTLTLT